MPVESMPSGSSPSQEPADRAVLWLSEQLHQELAGDIAKFASWFYVGRTLAVKFLVVIGLPDDYRDSAAVLELFGRVPNTVDNKIAATQIEQLVEGHSVVVLDRQNGYQLDSQGRVERQIRRLS